MNDIRFAYRYQQTLGYDLTNNKENEKQEENKSQNPVEASTEYKQYLNLPSNFKIGG